ncbi:MAG: lamin tail domain-containing protein [Lentisphaerae bacterium]|nr:lamin tail domain-containing protein [Lentisphaerota bacterium]MBT7053993.1 lamin tail domain-containing protein [Lentisphaerota bacterium]MBT7845762.1 lamin tail domain-containing protein [Lentisphaerota bacterium]
MHRLPARCGHRSGKKRASHFTGTLSSGVLADLFLSEIASFLPDADAPAAVEVINRGTNDADLSGWTLRDKDNHVFAFPKGTELGANRVLVVQFGEPSQESSKRESTTSIRCREEWADRAFRGRSNECALFSSAETTAGTLVDHVFWGRKPPSVGYADLRWLPLARQAKRLRWHGAVYIGNSPAPGDGAPLLPSGSIARMRFGGRHTHQNWYICRPEDVSLGELNTGTSPMPMHPWYNSGFSHEINTVRFIWTGIIPEDATYRLQIARDQAFRENVVDKLTKSSTHDLVIPEGRLFWRVRRESGDTAGRWSRPVEFRWRIEPTPAWKQRKKTESNESVERTK